MAKGFKSGGRQPGSRNKAPSEQAKAVAATGQTPLQYLMEVYRDKSHAVDRRVEAARSAAPYVHPRLSSVEMSGADGGPLVVNVRRYAGD